MPPDGDTRGMDTTTGSMTDTVRTISSAESASEAVIDAVADAKGVDPLDLDPMYDAIDPDALDSIFRDSPSSGTGSVELSFEMAGCTVVVREAGEVVVTPTAGAAGSAGRVPSHE